MSETKRHEYQQREKEPAQRENRKPVFFVGGTFILTLVRVDLTLRISPVIHAFFGVLSTARSIDADQFRRDQTRSQIQYGQIPAPLIGFNNRYCDCHIATLCLRVDSIQNCEESFVRQASAGYSEHNVE